jgi:hypothetical protein
MGPHTVNSQEASKFRVLNRMVSSIAKRDLRLLGAIDQTLDAIQDIQSEIDILTGAILHETSRIQSVERAIDEDGAIEKILEEARGYIEKLHSHLIAKCEAARNAPELKPDDGVVDAYCRVIDSVAALHNAINDIAWAIAEHDIDVENEWLGPFDNVEDMLRALKA